MTDFNIEIKAAFQKYCQDKQKPVLTPEAIGYIKHCLQKASRTASMLGEEPAVSHHPMFALMALECGDGRLVVEFIMATAP
jgi:hypothetical protein